MFYPRGCHYERYFIIWNFAKLCSITFDMAKEELFSPFEDMTLEMPGLSLPERREFRRQYNQLVRRARRDNELGIWA